MVLDSLDGRVARLTKTQSAFGAEYDSLSDMVSFGAAPALVVYEWALRGLGQMGWVAAFVYVAGAALRLARFNTMLDVADKRYFQGLPSPAAAALVAGFVWVVDDYAVDPETVRWAAWAVTVFAGLTMVTNFKYYSFKTINLRRSVPFVVVFGFVLFFVLVSYQPPIVLFAGFLAVRAFRLRLVGVAGAEAAASLMTGPGAHVQARGAVACASHRIPATMIHEQPTRPSRVSSRPPFSAVCCCCAPRAHKT